MQPSHHSEQQLLGAATAWLTYAQRVAGATASEGVSARRGAAAAWHAARVPTYAPRVPTYARACAPCPTGALPQHPAHRGRGGCSVRSAQPGRRARRLCAGAAAGARAL